MEQVKRKNKTYFEEYDPKTTWRLALTDNGNQVIITMTSDRPKKKTELGLPKELIIELGQVLKLEKEIIKNAPFN